MTKFLLVTLCVAVIGTTAKYYSQDNNFLVGRKQVNYRTEELTDEKFLKLSQLSDLEHLRETVRHIAVPRVVGTEDHRRVREYIVNSLNDLNWSVEVHKFHDTTPVFGKLHFHNIIAKLNPDAERYLVLGCHYDSKYFKDFNFVGATDSAVPCAMLINLAYVLQKELIPFREQATNNSNPKLSLMLIFFDGEEAFKEWTPTDSIYGARHLAKKWEQENYLDRLDMLLLLDLLGAPDPKFYSFFPNTESWYTRLIAIEERLSNAGLMERYVSSGVSRQYPHRYFQTSSLRSSQVEDDHIPFLRRNVPVLHMIPLPFPRIWHTENDNESTIDYATTGNLARIIRLFTMEYLLSSLNSK